MIIFLCFSSITLPLFDSETGRKVIPWRNRWTSSTLSSHPHPSAPSSQMPVPTLYTWWQRWCDGTPPGDPPPSSVSGKSIKPVLVLKTLHLVNEVIKVHFIILSQILLWNFTHFFGPMLLWNFIYFFLSLVLTGPAFTVKNLPSTVTWSPLRSDVLHNVILFQRTSTFTNTQITVCL